MCGGESSSMQFLPFLRKWFVHLFVVLLITGAHVYVTHIQLLVLVDTLGP